MNWLTTLLPIFVSLLTAAPSIIKAWDSAPNNSLQKVNSVVSALPPAVVAALSGIGAAAFPKLDPALHAAAAALTAVHTNTTSWLQNALNVARATGYISFTGDATDGSLVVDGIFGNHTKAALEAFQAKLGLPATGMFQDAEIAALTALLAKI